MAIKKDTRTNNKNNQKLREKSNPALISLIETDSESHIPYNYDNDIHSAFVKKLVKEGQKTSFSKFHKQHVMYSFIMALPKKHNNIIIKFGYTHDIEKRILTLAKEYGCIVYFIKAKIIKNIHKENKFHNMLQSKYPELIEKHTIKDTEKTELYKLNPILLKEFENYKNTDTDIDYISHLIDIEINIVEYINKIQFNENKLLKENMKLNKKIMQLDDKYTGLRDKFNKRSDYLPDNECCHSELDSDDIEEASISCTRKPKKITSVKKQRQDIIYNKIEKDYLAGRGSIEFCCNKRGISKQTYYNIKERINKFDETTVAKKSCT